MNKNDLTLYQITDELSALDEILESEAGELSEEWIKLLNDITPMLENKVDGCVGYINREKDLIKLTKERIRELQDYMRAKENKIKRFEEYIKFCLDKTGKASFQGELNEIKLRKPSQVLVIQDENQVPSEFVQVETVVKIDKAALKKAVKNNEVKTKGIYLDNGKPSLIFSLKRGVKK